MQRSRAAMVAARRMSHLRREMVRKISRSGAKTMDAYKASNDDGDTELNEPLSPSVPRHVGAVEAEDGTSQQCDDELHRMGSAFVPQVGWMTSKSAKKLGKRGKQSEMSCAAALANTCVHGRQGNQQVYDVNVPAANAFDGPVPERSRKGSWCSNVI